MCVSNLGKKKQFPQEAARRVPSKQNTRIFAGEFEQPQRKALNMPTPGFPLGNVPAKCTGQS